MTEGEASVEIFRKEGEDCVSVLAGVNAGGFFINTEDSGPMVRKFWGMDEYEFWTEVPRDAWGALLIALAKEFLADANGQSRFREICRKHGVAHKTDHWLSGG